MPISRRRLEFAATIFLAEMRRQHALQQPLKPHPVKSLDDYPEAQRSALMAALERAMKSAESSADNTFRDWLIRTNKSEHT